MKIEEFRVTWTADHEQYFQGHGIACTDYTHCATGYGSTLRESFEDAITQLQDYVITQADDEKVAVTLLITEEIEIAMLAELESQVVKPEILDWDIAAEYCKFEGEHTIEHHDDDCSEDCESEACVIEDDDPDCSVCAVEWHYVMIDLKVGD